MAYFDWIPDTPFLDKPSMMSCDVAKLPSKELMGDKVHHHPSKENNRLSSKIHPKQINMEPKVMEVWFN